MMQQAPGMGPPLSMPLQSQQYQQPPPQTYPQQPLQQSQHWMMPPPPPPQVWGQQPPAPHQQVAPPAQQPAGPLPPQQYYQQPASAPQPASTDEVRTLWIGDLQYWMDENYLSSCFAHTNEVVSVKVIRNKHTLQPEGYGFVEFVSRAAAERILQTYNGTLMPNVEQNFRLNWALYGAGERRVDDSPDYTIFVGDLAADVTDYILQETFRARYPSVKSAKVVIDRTTGRTKGYGFVKFADESEQLNAMTEMNGVLCSTRPMRIGPAANKKNTSGTASYQTTQGTPKESDPNNTTIFVGNLDSNVTDEHLRQVFSPYGELVHVKIPVGKRCGFVQFVNRSCAEEALRMLNGTQLGGQNIRLSWGRSPSNKQESSVGVAQPQADLNQWNAGYYGYPQGYDSYSYAAQDPTMYYGGYPGYGNYTVPQQQPQQQVQQQ
ncbi:Polyadenylate-binding protein rbp45 [Ancistrocladus abbreviatus]